MTYTAWFDEIRKDDIPLAGGKGANLGELIAATSSRRESSHMSSANRRRLKKLAREPTAAAM